MRQDQILFKTLTMLDHDYQKGGNNCDDIYERKSEYE